jgi:hypothetical protein
LDTLICDKAASTKLRLLTARGCGWSEWISDAGRQDHLMLSVL